MQFEVIVRKLVASLNDEEIHGYIICHCITFY